jgi:Domain of unknown function (DUF4432)
MEIAGRTLSRRQVRERTGDPRSVAGVRAMELSDGVERGVRVLQFRTGGGLSFELLVDRALDVGTTELDGLSLGWQSPTGFRHPGLHEYESEDGLSWARSFSGTLCTGGLDHTLFGGRFDASHYRYPPREQIQQSLHGRIAHTPATLRGYGETWLDDESCLLWAEAEVRQAAVFGEHLVLHRRVEATVGGTSLRIRDRVVNEGFEPTPHMFLYHLNFGWPLLDDGTRFVAPISSTRWCTDSAWDQGTPYDRCTGPVEGYLEQVYEHDVAPDPDGVLRALLANDRLARAALVEWRADQFPHLLQWMNLRAGAYGFGIEPTTHHVEGQQAARDDGSMIWLRHGEAREYDTTISFLRGAEHIAEAEERIRAVQAQPPEPTPPPGLRRAAPVP